MKPDQTSRTPGTPLAGAFALLCLVGMVAGLALFASNQGLIYPFWLKPDPAAVAVARDIRERPERWAITSHTATRLDGSLAIWWPSGAWGIRVCANQTHCYGDSTGFNEASRYIIHDAIKDVLAPRLHATSSNDITKAAQP
ncbi:hypothetical protein PAPPERLAPAPP_02330 [Brevundimonas phage vB_BpoS-Papperlapapp]|nr:hypothetical protein PAPPERLAPAPP_02330 [Brevundimonas phage vB_BpoS-Papperlapapp]